MTHSVNVYTQGKILLGDATATNGSATLASYSQSASSTYDENQTLGRSTAIGLSTCR